MKNGNSPIIEYRPLFNRQRKSAPLAIKIAFREVLELFLDDPDHPSLRNHLLRNKFSGFRSIDVTSDYRALFKIQNTETQITITFYLLGTHKQLYG